MTRMVDVKELPDLIGKEVGVSDWVKVDQDRIDRFADLCGDHQWIHVDVERAQREIGGTIAHGFLTMSLMSTMSAQIMRVKDVKRGLNYGFNKLRYAGSSLRDQLPYAGSSKVQAPPDQLPLADLLLLHFGLEKRPPGGGGFISVLVAETLRSSQFQPLSGAPDIMPSHDAASPPGPPLGANDVAVALSLNAPCTCAAAGAAARNGASPGAMFTPSSSIAFAAVII